MLYLELHFQMTKLKPMIDSLFSCHPNILHLLLQQKTSSKTYTFNDYKHYSRMLYQNTPSVKLKSDAVAVLELSFPFLFSMCFYMCRNYTCTHIHTPPTSTDIYIHTHVYIKIHPFINTIHT